MLPGTPYERHKGYQVLLYTNSLGGGYSFFLCLAFYLVLFFLIFSFLIPVFFVFLRLCSSRHLCIYLCSQVPEVRHTFYTSQRVRTRSYIHLHTYCTGDPLVPLHTLYSRTYIVHGTSWYQKYELIPARNTSSGLNSPRAIRAHIGITTKLHELQTALDASRGEWRAK